ncbi:unnamed protein product [Rhizophagus irregularis]|nr:unnamed protein product [Rhizophagus irregularis]
MASLCRKPKLLSSLQGILKIVNITSHTQRHERNLEKIRALLVDPTSQILHGETIWNLGIIDNIDFKETTFGYGNIFDAIRGNSHATLRMLFQYQLPELPEILEVQEIIHNQQQLFGQNSFSQKTFHTFNLVFEKLLAFSENFTYQSDFDESDIRNQIMTYFKVGCNFSPPNVIILNAGDPPSSDSAVHKCLKISKPHNIQSRKEKIWELVHQLINAFESENPLKNPIFELLNQEILLTENYTTVGRRARNITRITLADIAKMKKERKIEEREEKEKAKKSGRGRGRGRGKGKGRRRERGRGSGDEEATT